MSRCICSAATIKDWSAHSEYCPVYMKGRIEELEAQLDAVRLLPERWRKDPSWETLLERSERRKCADELKAAIGEES